MSLPDSAYHATWNDPGLSSVETNHMLDKQSMYLLSSARRRLQILREFFCVHALKSSSLIVQNVNGL